MDENTSNCEGVRRSIRPIAQPLSIPSTVQLFGMSQRRKNSQVADVGQVDQGKLQLLMTQSCQEMQHPKTTVRDISNNLQRARVTASQYLMFAQDTPQSF